VPDPLYRQIADELQRNIESGALRPGSKLPTEPALAKQYSAGRNTVRNAIRWLTTRGLVTTSAGQGTFVRVKAEPFVITLSPDSETGVGGGEGQAFLAEVRARGKEPFAGSPRVEIRAADGVIADELKLAAGTMVVSRHQERLIDGKPYSLQTSYYPMSLVEAGAVKLAMAMLIEPGTVSYLQDVLGLRQARYRDKITVRAPGAAEMAFFRLQDGGLAAVFEKFRTAYDSRGEPFRLTVSMFAADRSQFVVVAGQVPARARADAGDGLAAAGGDSDG
jgi:GntR family transcriptional regulator